MIPLTTNSTDGGPPTDGSIPTGDGTVPLDGSLDGEIPTGTWRNVTSNLANMSSQCGNMAYVSAKPDQDLIIAGVALLGLWGSTNGGVSWQPLGQSAADASADASPPITNRPSSIAYDPSDTKRFWESGLYNSDGAYVTSDQGATFLGLGENNCDGISVDFTDPTRQTLLLGGHEMSHTLYRSANGGTTWTAVGANPTLPDSSNCTYPLVINAQTHLVGCGGYGGGASGIYRTTDGATTWTNVSALGGNGLPLVASDGSIYWASPDGAGMARSTDQGQTWSMAVGPGVVNSYHPIELPDGRIATLGPPDSGTEYVLASADHGVTWQPISSALPYTDAEGLTYSAAESAFYIWHFTCPTTSGTVPVPADAIMAYDFKEPSD